MAFEWAPGWTSFGTNNIDGPSASLATGGDLAVFVRRTDGQMLYYSQSASDGAWSELPLGGKFTSDPDSTVISTGGLLVAGRGTDDQLYFNYKLTPDHNWSGWSTLGAPPDSKGVVGGPGCTRPANASAAVFIRGPNSDLWHRAAIWLPPFPSLFWSPWLSLGGEFTSDPDAAPLLTSGMLVAGRGTDNQVYINYQLSPDGNWSGWSTLGAPDSKGVVGGPGCASAGLLTYVFVRAADSEIWYRAGVGGLGFPSLFWSPWTQLGGDSTSDPDCTVNADGGLVVVGRGVDGQLRYRGQKLSREPEPEPPRVNPYPAYLRRDSPTSDTWSVDIAALPAGVPQGARVAGVTFAVLGTVPGNRTAVVTHEGLPGQSQALNPGDQTFAFNTQPLTGKWRALISGTGLNAPFSLDITWT